MNSLNEEGGCHGSILIATPDVSVEWSSIILLSKKGTHEGNRTKKAALTFDTVGLVQMVKANSEWIRISSQEVIKGR